MLRLSCSDQPKGRDTLFAMNTITQTMRFRQAVITYSEKYGVTKAAIRYQVNRQYIYRWKKRYDGSLAHTHQGIMEKQNAVIAKTIKNFMLLTASILFKISKRNLPYGKSV